MMYDIITSFLVGLRHFLIGFAIVIGFELKMLKNGWNKDSGSNEAQSKSIWIGLLCQSLLFALVALMFDNLLIPLNMKAHEFIIGHHNLIDQYQLVISLGYAVCWCSPAFILSRIYGEKIASLMFKRTWQNVVVVEGERQQAAGKASTYFSMSDKFKQLFTLCSTFAVVTLFKIIAADFLICRLLANVLLALVYAFYAFDFSWVLIENDFDNRCDKVARYWSYFAGFAILFVVVVGKASEISFLTGTAMYVIIYPILIMVATRIELQNMYPKYQSPFSLSIFYPAKYLANRIIDLYNLLNAWFVQKYEPSLKED
ncbi:hypothetical protein GJ496_008710 [Pomphorhynchus laevis]|nr:hypothetical protein GJ496_008710 [Pomphorhynchus laevis]